jgi:hypothetical protein
MGSQAEVRASGVKVAWQDVSMLSDIKVCAFGCSGGLRPPSSIRDRRYNFGGPGAPLEGDAQELISFNIAAIIASKKFLTFDYDLAIIDMSPGILPALGASRIPLPREDKLPRGSVAVLSGRRALMPLDERRPAVGMESVA